MTTTLGLLGVLLLVGSVVLLWTVRHAAMEARAVVDRLTAVRDRVVPLANQAQADAERVSEHLAALQEPSDAERARTTYPRSTS